MNLFKHRAAHMALIALAVAFIYSNTLDAPFIFDDAASITQNPAIADISYFANPSKLGVIGDTELGPLFKSRLFGYFTFYLNHLLAGFQPAAYHLTNLAIHIASSLLLYALIAAALKTPRMRQTSLTSYTPLAAAMLFAVHPVQTQAVTYIVQRFASLAAMLYIGALLCYALARNGSSKRCALYILALLLSVLAMKTKETAFTLPVMIALFEWMFFEDKCAARLRRLAPFALTLLIIPFTLLASGDAMRSISKMDEALGRADYMITQLRVVVTYLRLLIWPAAQNIDYDYSSYSSLSSPEVAGSALLLLSMLGGGLWLQRRGPQARLAAFGIFWFFITLSVESGLVPIKDVIFEHRLYLPSAGIAMAAGAAVMRINKSAAYAALVCVVLALAVATFNRNALWRDPVTLWRDAAEKSPNKFRVLSNLGDAYFKAGLYREAAGALTRAAAIKPDDAIILNNAGGAYAKLGQSAEAVAYYKRAASVRPTPEAFSNIGVLQAEAGRLEDAAEAFKRAISLAPGDAGLYYGNLGNTYAAMGRHAPAAEAYRQAVSTDPSQPELRLALISELLLSGDRQAAIKQTEELQRISPAHAASARALLGGRL